MRILHTSDLHGSYKALLATTDPFDVWVDTGDFFPNQGRTARTGYSILPALETRHQRHWYGNRQLGKRLRDWLGGRPVISVPGNHDFITFREMFAGLAVDLHMIGNGVASVGGMTWAGFRHIPFVDGDWPGETDDFADLIAQAKADAPDVLVTHAPDAGFAIDCYGIPGLHAALDPKTRLHLHGHDHANGGSYNHTPSGLRVMNSATHIRTFSL